MKSFQLEILPMMLFVLFLVINFFTKEEGNVKSQDQETVSPA